MYGHVSDCTTYPTELSDSDWDLLPLVSDLSFLSSHPDWDLSILVSFDPDPWLDPGDDLSLVGSGYRFIYRFNYRQLYWL